MIPKEFVESLNQPFARSMGFPGSGTLLAFKMLLNALDSFVLVTSNRWLARSEISMPAVVADNAPAAARGIAHSLPVVAFAGDMTTLRHMSALGGGENVLYVCANNHGSEQSGAKQVHTLAPRVAASYTATASIAHPEDFAAKLRKAFAMDGFRFIEVFAPSPYLWDFEPSMTVEVARVATESAVWPVFEFDGALTLTRRPLRPEPVETYLKMVKQPGDAALQGRITRRWKLLLEGKLA